MRKYNWWGSTREELSLTTPGNWRRDVKEAVNRLMESVNIEVVRRYRYMITKKEIDQRIQLERLFEARFPDSDVLK